MCGAGGMIKQNINSIFKWNLCYDIGTNTRVELMGAWASLHLASRFHIDNLHLIGDSRVIIDWLNHLGKLNIITLLAWKDRIRSLLHYFKNLTFTHTSREFNRDADLLSKAILQGILGLFIYNQWQDGHQGPTHTIKIF
jgi:ribonuclease HI